MIRVVMFDLGDTLIDADRHPFPHVAEALSAIAEFKTEDGKPLQCCLVSDFTPSPRTPARITELFNQYVAILDQTGLRPFFEPVKKRVTLSTQAGASKPDGKIFQKALDRLGSRATLTECLLVTENAEHIASVRANLHMQALQFRPAGGSHFDFADWSEAPALIANLVAPHRFANTEAALRAHLAAQGVEVTSAEASETPGAVQVEGQVWYPISVPGADDLQEVHVKVPVKGKVSRGPKGEFKSAQPPKPSPEHIAEAQAFVKSLAANKQIAGRTGEKPFQPTHEIETDKQGKRKLVRKRFTAL